ncbi:MAG: response regulator transcription factor [Candidatus Pacebacteria bacterium]|nr:response regulator transcription factor [Candidatus Paceibacterota bacterium]MBP9840686.1 response regulator transcription factor [Candidatus Paceibacterota bacterium]
MDIDAIIIGVDGDADEITLREIRHAKYLGPVVVLTAKSIGHQTTLLAHGATMTMNTYADPMLIYAQLEALIRFGGRAPVGVRHVSGLIFDMHRKIVVHENGEPVHLTGKEYEVLELLMLRRGMVISKEQFLNHLYGGIDEPELKIVDVFICKLRKKLKTASGGKEIIETVWGRGYTIPHARQSEVIATA